MGSLASRVREEVPLTPVTPLHWLHTALHWLHTPHGEEVSSIRPFSTQSSSTELTPPQFQELREPISPSALALTESADATLMLTSTRTNTPLLLTLRLSPSQDTSSQGPPPPGDTQEPTDMELT